MILTHDFIKPYFVEVDAVLNNYVYNGYQALMHYIQIPLGMMIVLAIGFMGYKCYTTNEVKIKDFYSFAFKFSFIYFFALNWGHFSQYIVTFFNDAVINGMSSALLDANPIHSFSGISDLETSLQLMSDLFGRLAQFVIGQASWHELSPFFYGSIIWLVTTIMIALVIIEMTLAKIMMAILFVVAPVIIPCVMFEKTKSIFTNWMGNLVGYSLLLVFVSALMSLCASLVFWVIPISSMHEAISLDNLATGITPFLIVVAVVIYALTKVHAMAMQIGSGVASGGTGAGLAMGLVSGFSMARMMSTTATGGASRVFGVGASAAKGARSVVDSSRNMAQNIGQRIKNRMHKE